MPETDTYRELAARLGMGYRRLEDSDADAIVCFDDLRWMPQHYAHAIIRDRAAEALRDRGYNVTGPYPVGKPWFIKDLGPVASYSRALDATDYATALLAALDLAGIHRQETKRGK